MIGYDISMTCENIQSNMYLLATPQNMKLYVDEVEESEKKYARLTRLLIWSNVIFETAIITRVEPSLITANTRTKKIVTIDCTKEPVFRSESSTDGTKREVNVPPVSQSVYSVLAKKAAYYGVVALPIIAAFFAGDYYMNCGGLSRRLFEP